MNLEVTQQLQKGCLKATENKEISITLNGASYDIVIKQCGVRMISINSISDSDKDLLLDIFNNLNTLLMLFDGKFVPIVKISVDSQDITQDFSERVIPIYHSADSILGSENILIDFSKILDVQIFSDWIELRKELDIIHNMVLYCLSDLKIPIDMKCAFMIEVFEGLSELIKLKKPEIRFEKAEKGESQLKKYLMSFINIYGMTIFDEEIKFGIDKITQILVNSRNRIGHIKRTQRGEYLSVKGNLVYLLKLSLLYRVVLLDLLGISEVSYRQRLSKRTGVINSLGITEKLFTGTAEADAGEGKGQG